MCLFCSSCLVAGDRSLSTFFFFNDTATTEIYTLSLHDALPICFAESLVLSNTPQEIADFVITRHVKGNDEDRKSTRLNSSHLVISYAVFCLKKKKNETERNHAIRKVLVMSIYEFSSTAALKNTF